MKAYILAATPQAYMAAVKGWRKPIVVSLRDATLGVSKKIAEEIKWTNLVFGADGPVAMIRVEESRVLFGFWRGQRLREIEPRLKPGGKYEMATMTLLRGDAIDAAKVAKLVRAAVKLNRELGDPTALNT